MDIDEAVTEFTLANYDKQGPTQRWYRQKVGVFAEWCKQEGIDLEELRPSNFRRFLEHVKSHLNRDGKPITNYTLHGYAQVVKGFLHFCVAERFIDQAVYAGIREHTKMPRVDQKVIETFTVDQIRRLVQAAEKEAFPQLVCRDRAMIYTLLDTGIRAGELCALTLENSHLSDLEPYIRVYGKGRKEREVGMSQKAAREVRRYIQRFRDTPESEQHVFMGRKNIPLTPSGVDQILYRLEAWSHIKGVRCSAHTFRHTYAVNYLLAGGDLYMLSRLLGHSDTKTTEIYLRSMQQRQVRRTSFSLLDKI
jgi:site-specific recombinase XerD